jgi:hypothetical protein
MMGVVIHKAIIITSTSVTVACGCSCPRQATTSNTRVTCKACRRSRHGMQQVTLYEKGYKAKQQ